MQIKRRMMKRTEILEQIWVKVTDRGAEGLPPEHSKIEGGNFFLQIFRNDAAHREKLFECDLRGQIEIEQTSDGGILLVCRRAP
jgi:hypothetical protein